MTEEAEHLSFEDATDLIRRALKANGVPEMVAASVASALVAAEAEGQVGHGFSRLSDYIAQVKSGKIQSRAVPKVSRPLTSLVEVDAGYGFAYPALDAAISEGLEVARATGIASMAIRRSHHCGALSVQVDRIARHGLIGLMVANAPAAIAPWGAREPVFGTNPIAFATPRSDRSPLVIDLSLSKVARGKVMHAQKSGKPIPEGWALDAEGNPTTDAEAALAGTMLPIGGAKGTALALMVEILSAIVTGANTSREATSFFAADGRPPGTGQFLLALRPGEGSDFAGRLEALLEGIEGLAGARLPGARRIAALEAAHAKGLMVPKSYVKLARDFASVANEC